MSIEKYEQNLKSSILKDGTKFEAVMKDKCDLCNKIKPLSVYGICEQCFNKLIK